MLTEIARRAAVEFADTDAFVTEHGWAITYAELDRAADEAAAGLADRGIGEGSVVALATPSNVDYVVAYLAAAPRCRDRRPQSSVHRRRTSLVSGCARSRPGDCFT